MVAWGCYAYEAGVHTAQSGNSLWDGGHSPANKKSRRHTAHFFCLWFLAATKTTNALHPSPSHRSSDSVFQVPHSPRPAPTSWAPPFLPFPQNPPKKQTGEKRGQVSRSEVRKAQNMLTQEGLSLGPGLEPVSEANRNNSLLDSPPATPHRLPYTPCSHMLK